jgi:hypothetical protein
MVSLHYKNESWISPYWAAMAELESIKVTGRIIEARTAAKAQIEKLRDIPDLHTRERTDIEEALGALDLLSRMHESNLRTAVDRTLQSLRKLEPIVLRQMSQEEPNLSRPNLLHSIPLANR